MPRKALGFALGAALLLALPFLHLGDFPMRVATMICVYAAAATGWTVLGGYANQISLMQATSFGLGAYTSTLLFARLHVNPWLGMVAGACVAALIAAAVGALAFRLRGHYFALTTLAFAEMIRTLVEYLQPLTGGAQGVSVPFVSNSFVLLQFPSARDYYEIAAVLLLVTLFVARAILFSPLGFRLRAIRDDELAARLAGVNAFRTKMQALLIGAAISAFAGTLYAQITGFVDPDSVLAVTLSVQFALYAIVGGAQTWWGALAGTALLYPLSVGLTGSGGGVWSGLAKVAYGVVLIAIVVVEPGGIAGFIARRRRTAPLPPAAAEAA